MDGPPTMAAPMPLSRRPEISHSAVPTPSHGPGGSWTVSCSTTMAAPPATVLGILLDTRTYASWNAFCPHATITQQPAAPPPPPRLLGDDALLSLPTTLRLGTRMVLDAHLDPHDDSKTNQAAVIVSVLQEVTEEGDEEEEEDGEDGQKKKKRTKKGLRVAWRTDGWMPGWMLRAERVQELYETPDGRSTQYRCWETFYGALAPVVHAYAGTSLLWGFGAWMDGLREHAEEQARRA